LCGTDLRSDYFIENGLWVVCPQIKGFALIHSLVQILPLGTGHIYLLFLYLSTAETEEKMVMYDED